MLDAILLHGDDNVVTVTRAVSKGESVSFLKDGKTRQVTAAENIPEFHKISIADIPKNADVTKYGERIGYATVDIRRGQHVHTQNMDNQ